jgi:hypothetical protein
MKEIKDLKVGSKLKVIKSIFIFSEDNLSEGVFYSKEEIESKLDCFIKEGDVWEVILEFEGMNGENYFELECIEGSMKGEINEGWFDFNDEIVKKDCFELI